MRMFAVVLAFAALLAFASGQQSNHQRDLSEGHDHGDSEAGSAEDLDSLPDYPVCVDGNYPLFKSEALARAASMEDTAHQMSFAPYALYMPNGMKQKDSGMGGFPKGMTMKDGGACKVGTIDATGLAVHMTRGRVCVMGMWPMYKTAALAIADADGDGTAHAHAVGNFTLFMPNGMVGTTTKHGVACPAGTTDVSSEMELHEVVKYQNKLAEAAPADDAPSTATHEVTTMLTASNAVEDFGDMQKMAIKLKVARELEVSTSNVTIDVAGGSVTITIKVGYDSETAASAGATSLAAKLDTAADASEFLSTTAMSLAVESIDTAPAAASTSNIAGIVGAAVGGALCAIGILSGVYHLMRKKKAATHKPAAGGGV